MNELDQQRVFITPAQLTARWGGQLKVGTLANWRHRKIGPPFAKLGNAVMYPLDRLKEWEEAQLQHSDASPANDNEPTKAETNENE
ncbi:hypothetical protein [Terasakiella sp.]|uniref:hypothetical protein n=1 Tax=Terasakiella sp. TaxID=2034861 RepID=UPI003AA7B4C4